MSDAVMQDELLVPAMGFAAGMVSVAVWLVDEGATVLAGDRVVQLVAGAATVDLVGRRRLRRQGQTTAGR